ncbi:MAG: energy transducer TonB [Sphingobacteriaceae bacterium]|nr:energy transducer TonB [Sphingobacteriaceae bacterium]
MKKLIYIFLCFSFVVTAQTKPAKKTKAGKKSSSEVKSNVTEAEDSQPPPPQVFEQVIEEEVFVIVEEMPEYPGGQAAFDQDLKLAMKQTKEAKEKLFVKFTVDKSGTIKDPVVTQEGNCVDCKAALLEGILKLKKYRAGRQNGRAVNVSLTVPVAFNIN